MELALSIGLCGHVGRTLTDDGSAGWNVNASLQMSAAVVSEGTSAPSAALVAAVGTSALAGYA